MSGGAIRDIRTSPQLRLWIADAYPRYLDELVPLGAAFERDANGVWQPDLLPYWIEDSNECAALAFVRDEPVAFAFAGLQTFPFRRHDTQYCLAELWVAPEHRRDGTGRAFAHALFAQYPGTWELTVLPANARALQFWRAVIPEREEVVGEDGIDFIFVSPDGVDRG